MVNNMSRQNLNRMTGFVVLILVLVVFNSNLLGIIWYNDTNTAFLEQNKAVSYLPNFTTVTSLNRIPIVQPVITNFIHLITDTKDGCLEDFINESAANFLDSYSKWILFSTKGDNTLASNLDGAIEYMESTKKSFIDLVQKSEKTHYNPPVILKLENFNYDQFRERKGLREDVFKKVKKFLSKGDMRGMYKETLPLLENILKMSKDIRSKLKEGKAILQSDITDLDRLYSEAMFQGQYATQIFGEIKKEKPILLGKMILFLLFMS